MSNAARTLRDYATAFESSSKSFDAAKSDLRRVAEAMREFDSVGIRVLRHALGIRPYSCRAYRRSDGTKEELRWLAPYRNYYSGACETCDLLVSSCLMTRIGDGDHVRYFVTEAGRFIAMSGFDWKTVGGVQWGYLP